MTERQQRLQVAGARLARGAALIGGGAGLVLFFTALTGQQRLVFLFLVCALTMPLVLLGLALTGHRNGQAGQQLRLTRRDVPFCLGAAFVNVLIFVQADAYLALMTVAVTGLVLTCGVRVAAGIRPRGKA